MKLLALSSTIFFLLLFSTACDYKVESDETKPADADTLKNITRLEKFLGKKGELYVKDFYEVGTVKSNTDIKGSMDITAIVMYNPGEEGKRIKGLKIEIKQKEYTGYSSYDKTQTAFLDLEELKGIVDAIQYMTDLIKKWETEKKEYTEVIYTTTGNFNVGFFMKENSKNIEELYAFVQAGYSKVGCYFNPDVINQLNQVKEKINEGITLLNSK